jgi:hypothetical protein
LAQVSGKVTIDGRPFAEGKVMFAPLAKGEDRKSGRAAFGRLSADGSFTLSTYEQDDGAVVGEHWVTLIHIKPELAGGSPPQRSGAPAFDRLAVPRKVTVVAGQENRIDIQLTGSEVAQFGMVND